ncbi:MAG: lipopolysaccharide biosynthesis protein, partial [Bacteroidota bacterium]
ASFLISSAGITQQALMERKLEFTKLARAEIAATFFGAAVGITLAFSGAGVWSLVFQALSSAVVSTILLSFFFSSWRPRLLFDFTETKEVARFSLNLSGFNITNYFVRNADYLLIGKFLGAQELGYYSLAYRIMLYPLQNVTSVISRVMFPVYSRIRDDNKKFKIAYLDVAGTIALITFPMMLGMMGVSNYFVSVFFGEKWRVVSLLLIIFSPVGLLQTIEATTGAIYLAQSRTDWMFRWGVGTGLFTVVCFAIGLKWGIVGVASSYLISTLVGAYPCFRIPFTLIDLNVKDLIKKVWKPFLCSLLMLCTIYAASLSITPGFSNGASLAILFILGVSSYYVASRVFLRKEITQVLSWLKESLA